MWKCIIRNILLDAHRKNTHTHPLEKKRDFDGATGIFTVVFSDTFLLTRQTTAEYQYIYSI